MTGLKEWLTQREQEDIQLYERYGKVLESEHSGKFVAIGPEGQTLLGEDDSEVFREAVETFGSGNFGFFRVGHRALEKWLKANH
ncbi:MAG TPA: hypothetical protein VFA32_23670 [Dehalococcoidia bacterium]|jgi:hypothetical protein|nr:hypothetical protein [Dehalococcoidia bacterium]